MYKRTFWQDEVKQYDDRYRETQNADGTITHTPVPGEVEQEGTPQNEVTLNNIEEGITAAHEIGLEAALYVLHNKAAIEAILAAAEADREATAARFLTLETGTETGFFASLQMYNEALLATMHHETTLKGLTGIAGTVRVTNTLTYPFNNSGVTVAISPARNTTDYSVDAVVLSETGGQAGRVEIYDKLVNGFKVRFTGSASAVEIKYIIRGGVL